MENNVNMGVKIGLADSNIYFNLFSPKFLKKKYLISFLLTKRISVELLFPVYYDVDDFYYV